MIYGVCFLLFTVPKTKYLLANRIFMSSLVDQGLFDNQGGLGLGQVSMAIMFTPPPWVFDKSHELARHALAIRLCCSELEAAFDSPLLPLIRPLFLVVYLVLVPFFLARTFTGQTYYNRIHSCSVCFNKSGYGPIVHSHIAPT